MKNKTKTLLFLVIPILTLVYSVVLRKAEGPFYLNTLYDPVYVYLVSSLNIAQLVSPVHVDHPGTPVQVIGAIVIRLVHLFRSSSGNISEDVLSNPEMYLGIFHLVLVLINCIVLYIFAQIIYKSTNNFPAAILLQLSPFVSFTVSYELLVITAETLLIPVCLLLFAFSMKYISDDKYYNSKNFIYIFSALCGLGLASKLTFIPVIIIPLILLKNFKSKVLFLLFTFLFFFIFFLPAISNFNYILNWVKNLFIHDGIYGTGTTGIVNPGTFFINLKDIFVNDILFTILYLLILTSFIIIKIKIKSNSEQNKNDLYYSGSVKLLFAILLSVTFQLIIVSKHYSVHYMVPGLIFCIPALFLCIQYFSNADLNLFKNFRLSYLYFSFTIILISIISIETVKNYSSFRKSSEDFSGIVNFIDSKYPDAVLITSFGSSSKEYALAFSTTWAGRNKEKYMAIINKNYPNTLYYEYWKNTIFSMGNENLSKLLNSNRKIIFQNVIEQSNDEIVSILKNKYNLKDCSLSKVYSVQNGEAVYEINSGQ